jgi:hypothetical protein
MARVKRKFTSEELAEIRRLRSINVLFVEIAHKFNTNVQCIKNAFYRGRPTRTVTPQDCMPAALKAWPAGVDFGPDELEVRA